MYDTEGITGAVIHLTLPLDSDQLQQPREVLERILADPVELRHFEITNAHVEFIEGRVA